MPELPEVEHVRQGLAASIVGARVRRVRVHRRDVIVTDGDPPGGFSRSRRTTDAAPRRVRSSELLGGDEIRDVLRHGKQLAIVGASGRVVCVHLGMTGRVLVGAESGMTHEHVRWTLEDGTRLSFCDARRFGGLWCYDSEASLRSARWDALGPDALHVTAKMLQRVFASRARPIKAVLLDQTLVAGLGNIYVDESLFASGILPTRMARDVTDGESRDLARHARRILRRAIRAGGSTLRDFVGVEGQKGGYRLRHIVYGRAGQPCRRCRTTLESDQVGQRTTVWCPSCQT
ncbi:MAG: bifunctional DNA-formamidopyrimidine glycosylase/DNA-(apurinic or apyrimidinic site) lyase [Planctomycetota bacterium]